MRSTSLRFAAFLAATTMIITGIQSVAAPAPARAERQDTDFTLSVFPIKADEVHFRDSWGARRSGGRSHKGTDILAERGSEVLAVADGIVSKMAYHYLAGYYVIVDHGAGNETAYLHLNNDHLGTDDGEGGTVTAYFPTLTVGTEVAAGDIIGYVGDSGNAERTTPHTHFEIKLDGQKVDPYPFLEEVRKLEERKLPPVLTPF